MNNRPRFRFSLRTLFVVVTVGCVLLGYQLNWIQQRHAFLAKYPDASRPGMTFYTSFSISEQTVNAPWPIRIFGEKGCVRLKLDCAYATPEAILAAELFPEARIEVHSIPPATP